jgi:hypothetical protein
MPWFSYHHQRECRRAGSRSWLLEEDRSAFREERIQESKRYEDIFTFCRSRCLESTRLC